MMKSIRDMDAHWMKLYILVQVITAALFVVDLAIQPIDPLLWIGLIILFWIVAGFAVILQVGSDEDKRTRERLT